MKKEQLLAEVEEILRTMPAFEAFGGSQANKTTPWIGRAAAAIQRWSIAYMPASNRAAKNLHSDFIDTLAEGFSEIHTLLHQALSDLRMDVGPLSVVVSNGKPFNYFDELRKRIEAARTDVFFVDPYLDPDFVSRYLPFVAGGVKVRLLGRKGMPALLSAVEMFAKQSSLSIQVRSASGLHDRFLFVDKTACYLSGASFKDGALNASTVITQITDAFPAMWETYDGLWNAAKIEIEL